MTKYVFNDEAKKPKKWGVISLIALLLIIAALSIYYFDFNKPSSTIPAKQYIPPPKISTTKSTSIDHIFIIIEENKPYSQIVGNSQAAYINQLANQYSMASNYHSVAEPSLPNYIALSSGSTQGINTDCNPPSAGCEINATNIADEVEKSGRTWKEYAESMPSACYNYNSGEYATKHNPFIYYSDIVNNRPRCLQHVVPFSQLSDDLKSTATTPNLAFITPNLCNDMHDCSVAVGDRWLADNVPAILNSQAFTTQNSLLVITWDEGASSNNHILAALAGPIVKKAYRSDKDYSHYSLLRTIETLWNLPPLNTQDEQAAPMTEFLTSTKSESDSQLTIEYNDFGFYPNEVTIPLGTIVTVENDSTRGPLYFENAPGQNNPTNPALDLGTIDPGTSKSLSVNQAGVWQYQGNHNHEIRGLIRTGLNFSSYSQATLMKSSTKQALLVVYDDFGFMPNLIKVPVGTTVTIKNISSSTQPGPMRIQEVPGDINISPLLNLGIIGKQQSATFTIDSIGTWGFENVYQAPFGKGFGQITAY